MWNAPEGASFDRTDPTRVARAVNSAPRVHGQSRVFLSRLMTRPLGGTGMTHIRQLMQVMIATTALAIFATAAMADGAKIFVIGGKPDDPFWSKVKKGADDAGLVAKATGGSVTWLGTGNYDNLGPDAAKLIRTALAQ